jgi:hypothetical protein
MLILIILLSITRFLLVVFWNIGPPCILYWLQSLLNLGRGLPGLKVKPELKRRTKDSFSTCDYIISIEYRYQSLYFKKTDISLSSWSIDREQPHGTGWHLKLKFWIPLHCIGLHLFSEFLQHARTQGAWRPVVLNVCVHVRVHPLLHTMSPDPANVRAI